MKLVLHIGTEKTGTTSIQSWLAANRHALSYRQVFLSDVLGGPNNQILAHAFQENVDHYFLPMQITTVEKVRSFRKRLTDELASEVEAASKNHDCMVISSEQMQSRLLGGQEVERLAGYLRDLFSEITVVCYLRHQLEMRRSFYSTLVRMGYVGAIEEFDAEIDESSLYYNHLALVHRWENAFGRDRLLLREYSRDKLHRGDVVHDFVAYALPKLDSSGLIYSRSTKNSTLSGAHLMAYRTINRWLAFSDGIGGLRKGNARAKRMARAVLAPFAPWLQRPEVSPREKAIGEGIVSRFAESNRLLSEAYFEGNLFSDKRCPAPGQSIESAGDKRLNC